MKKFVLTSIVFLTISMLPAGCCFDSCCGETFDDPGKINVVKLKISFEKLESDDTIKANEYLSYNSSKFNINVLEYEIISQINVPVNYGYNVAYACSPPEPASDIFLRYKVISDQDVNFGDSIIFAGSDLSEYFKYQGYHRDGMFYLDFYDKYFTLNSAPSDTIDQNFEFELEMEDGEIFKLLVEDVRISSN